MLTGEVDSAETSPSGPVPADYQPKTCFPQRTQAQLGTTRAARPWPDDIALASYGARPWQAELTAEPIARALRDLPAQVKEAATLDDTAEPEG
jgi:sirohydrochlorin ferrochelatase